jgi:hypothetical protein
MLQRGCQSGRHAQRSDLFQEVASFHGQMLTQNAGFSVRPRFKNDAKRTQKNSRAAMAGTSIIEISTQAPTLPMFKV